jgi:predicted dehydrogenase
MATTPERPRDDARRKNAQGKDDSVSISIGILGAGNFGSQFTQLFRAHPQVEAVFNTDLKPEKAAAVREAFDLRGTFADFDEMLASDVDAIAIFTQRWLHGPLAVQALRAGKHVYSAVPMGISEEEISGIIRAVEDTGLVYMMGETSYHNPAAIFAREKLREGQFGRVFYTEGDYVHDMDLGFYKAYQRSGGANWQPTASFPPLMYPTHAIGGVLSVLPSHAVTVSAIGVRDQENDGVFDRAISMWDNDFSNATALFEMSDGGVMRTNEMRRAGYPSPIRESRFRFFGTEGSFEQLAEVSVWQDKHSVVDVSSELNTVKPSISENSLSDLHFASGYAPIQDTSRIPKELLSLPNGHEGVHHYLVDDFVRAVVHNTLPPVNAWQAARYTLPGIFAHASAKGGGARIAIPDFGDAPAAVDGVLFSDVKLATA